MEQPCLWYPPCHLSRPCAHRPLPWDGRGSPLQGPPRSPRAGIQLLSLGQLFSMQGNAQPSRWPEVAPGRHPLQLPVVTSTFPGSAAAAEGPGAHPCYHTAMQVAQLSSTDEAREAVLRSAGCWQPLA